MILGAEDIRYAQLISTPVHVGARVLQARVPGDKGAGGRVAHGAGFVRWSGHLGERADRRVHGVVPAAGEVVGHCTGSLS